MDFSRILSSAIAFVLIIGIVIIAHEFGHFLLAKLNGIKVVEFSVGMGPKIVKFVKGETTYVLRLLPIGGACMFESEDGTFEDDEEAKKVNDEKPLEKDKTLQEGAFNNASVWARIATVFAGPVFNFVLAYLLSLIIVGFCGSDAPVIADVVDGYPAKEAGLMAGDEIIRINHEQIRLFREITLSLMLSEGEEWEIEYKRDGVKYTTNVQPVYQDGSYKIGIYEGEYVDCLNGKIFKYSWYEVRYWLNATFKSLKMLVTGKLTRNDVAGPVGIVQVIDTTIEETKSSGVLTVVLNMINIALLISVNLGVMNLLPIPALDGGRLVFLVLEAIRRKPIPPKYESIVHLTGFALLMLITVLVLFNDVWKLFAK